MSEPLELDDEQPRPDPADFDAFFAEESAARPRQTITLYGTTYTLPDSLPLMFTLQAERTRNSSDPGDVRRLLATLFGRDTLDEWSAAGMTERQFGVLLIWAGANIKAPGKLGMREAAELYDDQEQQAQGKAQGPNRAARRAKPKRKKQRSSGKPS